jgi:uncharacterized membrane protein YgcG
MLARSVVVGAVLLGAVAFTSPARAQSTFPDANYDGVPDFVDQQCVCDSAAWKSHGKYVSCVAAVVEPLALDQVIEGDIMMSAAHTPCGFQPHDSNSGGSGGGWGGGGGGSGGGVTCSDCHKPGSHSGKGPQKCSDCHKK